ncbi:hypothetical protein N7456_003009 [Penicillium angulare]|uniref:Uncharacterized protein n=1 Tax=Penicillium angulare TaxID=116970 RepID=A0A9W9KH46_9EURO|nr:hypothetical protein N7456_003009 [Penicillium angulare]
MNKPPLPKFNYTPFLTSLGLNSSPKSPKQWRTHPNANWVHTTKPPLFWEPLSTNPLDTKLANIKEALISGADPNEMDHEPDPRRSFGRPLHCTIHDNGDWLYMKDNIPVIELLLEYGADPRLSGPMVLPVSCWLGSPLEDAREMAEGGWGCEELFRCGFYREAYRVMKLVAVELDRMLFQVCSFDLWI